MTIPKRIQFDTEKVPSAFALLIPLAQKWAIMDEGYLQDAVDACSHEELHELVNAVIGFDAPGFDEWLGGDVSYGAVQTDEWLAFVLLVDACDYARIRLKWEK